MNLAKHKKLGITRVRFWLVVTWWFPMFVAAILLLIPTTKNAAIPVYLIGAVGLILSSLILMKYDMDVLEEQFKKDFYG